MRLESGNDSVFAGGQQRSVEWLTDENGYILRFPKMDPEKNGFLIKMLQ